MLRCGMFTQRTRTLARVAWMILATAIAIALFAIATLNSDRPATAQALDPNAAAPITATLTLTPTSEFSPTLTPTPTQSPTLTPIFTPPVTFTPTATLTLSITPSTPSTPSSSLDKFVYLPIITKPDGCPTTSANQYATININSSYYKDNRLTDENADFRLSVLGYTPANQLLQRVNYGGDVDANAPNFYNVFKPQREITFAKAYERYDWNWDENAAPPYGTRGGVNHDWPVSVLDLIATKDEAVYMPRRNVAITTAGPYAALVLYADDDELTITYGNQDRVDVGYTVYLANLCVDPHLVALYRAQLSEGKRATGRLPVLQNDQSVGTSKQNFVTIAVRDSGPFLDPRSRKDWWQ